MRHHSVGRLARGATLVASLSLLVVALVAAARGPLPAAYPDVPAHPLEGRFLELVDAERKREGRAALRHSEVLALAARHHAAEMVALGYFDHESPTPANETLAQRVANAGGATVRLGENLAQVRSVRDDLAERTLRGWLESSAHRDNLLGEEWTHVGHGLAEHPDGRVFVVQVFAGDPNPLLRVELANGVQLRLAFERSVADLVVLVDEALAPTTRDGRELTLRLPQGDQAVSVMTGHELGGGRVAVIHALVIERDAAEPGVAPGRP